MKNAFAILVYFVSLSAFANRESGGVVTSAAYCKTSDGLRVVTVLKSTSRGAQPVYSAMITDNVSNLLASYAVQIHRGFQSASFGRFTYEDSKTGGQQFQLQGPSTNSANYVLKAIAKGAVLSDGNLDCVRFDEN